MILALFKSTRVAGLPVLEDRRRASLVDAIPLPQSGAPNVKPPSQDQRHHKRQPEQVADGEAETHGLIRGQLV